MQFSLKPVFIDWITLLMQLPFQLFFTIWSAVFFGSMFSAMTGEKGAMFFWGPALFFGALAFFGVPLVAYLGKKLNYGRTEYRFYEDRIEYEEGFFTINKKVIKYRDIEEVTLRKGFLQRFYDLGTIYLATPATGSGPRNNVFFALGFGNISGSGLGVRDIKSPDEIFEKIKAIVDRKNL